MNTGPGLVSVNAVLTTTQTYRKEMSEHAGGSFTWSSYLVAQLFKPTNKTQHCRKLVLNMIMDIKTLLSGEKLPLREN